MSESGRLLTLDDGKDNVLGEGVVLNAKTLDATKVLLESGYFGSAAIHLDMVAAGDDTHLGMHVLEAGDILVVDAVKRSCVEGVVEFY